MLGYHSFRIDTQHVHDSVTFRIVPVHANHVLHGLISLTCVDKKLKKTTNFRIIYYLKINGKFTPFFPCIIYKIIILATNFRKTTMCFMNDIGKTHSIFRLNFYLHKYLYRLDTKVTYYIQLKQLL